MAKCLACISVSVSIAVSVTAAITVFEGDCVSSLDCTGYLLPDPGCIRVLGALQHICHCHSLPKRFHSAKRLSGRFNRSDEDGSQTTLVCGLGISNWYLFHPECEPISESSGKHGFQIAFCSSNLQLLG